MKSFQVVSSCGVTIRISISNLYKVFKATATWLQFPYLINDDSKWTVLMFNLPYVLQKYLNRDFPHLKSVKLGANMEVKNVMSSNKLYNPRIIEADNKKLEFVTNPSELPFPREMRYPVPKNHQWSEFYSLIRFPAIDENISVNLNSELLLKSLNLNNRFAKQSKNRRVYNELPIVGKTTSSISIGDSNRVETSHEKTASQKIEKDFLNMSLIENINISPLNNKPSKPVVIPPSKCLCSLSKVIGLGPCKDLYFSHDGNHFYFAAGPLIIQQSIATSEQMIYEGHNGNILSFAVNGSDEFMASSQQNSPLVRFWEIATRECIGVVKSSESPIQSLQFASSDGFLLGIASVKQNSKLLIWDTQFLKIKGDVKVLCEENSDDVLWKARFCPQNNTRIASISPKRVHIWRIRNGKLKTCLISRFNGIEYDLTDVSWGMSTDDFVNTVFVSTTTGNVIQIDASKAKVIGVIDVKESPDTDGRSLNSIVSHEAFFVVASNDGTMKVWDLKFEEVILNAEHESSVESVSVSNDGLRLLALTDTESIGILDATTRVYKTVLRNHLKR